MVSKNRIQKLNHMLAFIAVIMVAGFLCAAPLRVSALTESGNVTVTVYQSFNKMGQSDGIDDTRSYMLEALDSSNPMPAGSSGGAYTFSLSGDDSCVFETSVTGEAGAEPALYFTHAGVYEYSLTPLTEEPNSRYTYEDTVYTVRVYVENLSDGSGLAVRKIVCQKSDNEKPDSITYHCSYKGEAENIVPDRGKPHEKTNPLKPKTGDTSNIAMWSILLVITSAMLLFFILKRRNDRERE